MRKSSCLLTLVAGAAFGALALVAVGCGGAPEAEGAAVRLEGETMGTRWMVRVRRGDGREGADTEALRRVVERELDAVDRAMSNWREDSEVSRWNARSIAAASTRSADSADGSVRAQGISAPLAEVVAAALEVHRDSGGAFDLTVAPLLRLFGFGPGGDPAAAAPARAAVEAARARVGSDRLRLERGPDGEARLHSAVPGIELDLSGIAKGYAVDRVSAALAAGGWPEHLIEVGGEIRVSGAWTVGIETPLPGPLAGLVIRVHRSFPVADLAVATSGGYRDFREAPDRFLPDGVPSDGLLDHAGGGGAAGPARRYWTHLFDPRLGRSVERRAGSVTVLAPTCLLADAWATALFVLGPEAGFALAERRGLAALFLTAGDDGTVADRATPAFIAATRPVSD